MADETTTTTESTTETTTEQQDNLNERSEEQTQADQEAETQETVTTTVTAEASTAPVAEKQGEVAVDKEATAGVVGDTDQQKSEDRLANARQDALTNQAAHDAEQPATNTTQAETASE